MDQKTIQLSNCLALATGALRAIEGVCPTVKTVRAICERELFGKSSEEFEQAEKPMVIESGQGATSDE